jgi:hypothetical protein
MNGLIFDGEEVSRKRPAVDDLSQPTKKLKSEQDAVLIDPAISYAFLLDPNSPLALYEAQTIALPIAIEIIIKTLEILPPQVLEDTLNVCPVILYLTVACSSTTIDLTSTSSK